MKLVFIAVFSSSKMNYPQTSKSLAGFEKTIYLDRQDIECTNSDGHLLCMGKKYL